LGIFRPLLSKRSYFAMLVASALALPAYGGCVLPPPPSKVPDGATTTEQDLLAAMQTLKRYSTDVNNYTKCLQFEANQNRLSPEEQAVQHNAAIDGLQAIAAKFNEQVRIFKARTGG
jgi:hypothetical protein